MDIFKQKLFEYCDTFGDNFPTMHFRDETQAAIIAMIDECIKKGEPIRIEDDRDSDI